ncbi:MAG: hypothetical protein ABJF11_03930 [Reichenbachiella sp.]|uniref:hypothetical protein n=1 Tax=Reichenbachiella sp. TaxID=2184521 RepID=UPI00326602A9
MDRKSFLKKASAALFVSIPLLSLWNCSSNSEDDPGPGDSDDDTNCLDNGTSVSIGDNHSDPHELVVSKSDVTAGEEKTYDITGSSGHPHSVTVTEDHFASLQSDQSVSISTSVDEGHSHTITVSCALA